MFGRPSVQPREDRRPVMLPVRLRLGAAWSSAKIRNISSRGLCVQISPPPARGTYIELYRQHHVIVGRVMWSEGERCGVRTQDPLDVRAVIEAVPAQPRGGGERRTAGRTASRSPATAAMVSRRLQQGALLAATLAAAAIGATTAVQTLARPLQAISARL